MKPRKPKDTASMKQVAKAYRKSTKPATKTNEGSRYFTEGAKSTYLGGVTRKNDYTPKAKSITLGGTRKNKPATVRKRGTV